jgi:hypothetical protein
MKDRDAGTAVAALRHRLAEALNAVGTPVALRILQRD